jgi:hypothetical protein
MKTNTIKHQKKSANALMAAAMYGLNLRDSRRITEMLQVRAANEARQNTLHEAKMTSHLPILQIMPGTTKDKHAITTAKTRGCLASVCDSSFILREGLTPQAQRRRPRSAPIATATLMPRSLQRLGDQPVLTDSV